jgi:hypothetical protein
MNCCIIYLNYYRPWSLFTVSCEIPVFVNIITKFITLLFTIIKLIYISILIFCIRIICCLFYLVRNFARSRFLRRQMSPFLVGRTNRSNDLGMLSDLVSTVYIEIIYSVDLCFVQFIRCSCYLRWCS